MVATFILTRIFAICATLAGVLQAVNAAPVAVDAGVIEERNCRILGCLFVIPKAAPSSAGALPVSAAPAITTAVPTVVDAVDNTGTNPGEHGLTERLALRDEPQKNAVSELEDSAKSTEEPSTRSDAFSSVEKRELDAEWASLLPKIDSFEK